MKHLPALALFAFGVFASAGGCAVAQAATGSIVSAVASADDGNVPANAIDGSLSTRWSALGVGQWIRGDLGTTRTLDAMQIAWYAGDTRSSKFVIDTSADGSTWSNAFSGSSSGKTTALETYTFAARSARYVRVTVNGNTSNTWASITELVAPPASTSTTSTSTTGTTTTTTTGSTSTASTTACSTLSTLTASSAKASADDGNVAANVLDGSLSTRWSCNGVGCWIQLDLGSSKTVGGVDLAWYLGDQRASNYVVSLSGDGTAFSQVYSGKSSGTTAQMTRTTFPAATGRYVRVTVNGNTSNNWASITELRADGCSSTTTTTTADTTPPKITAPANVTAVQTGTLTPVSLGTPTVTDNVDPSPKVTNNAPTGGFPVGTTTVVWVATDASGNSSTASQTVTITASTSTSTSTGSTSGSTTTTSTGADVFGTKAIYASASGGQEWHALWNSNPRTLKTGQTDPNDSRFYMEGSNQTLEIKGDGTANSYGDQIRMYIGDRSGTSGLKWKNTEFTMYSMRVADNNGSSLGFEVQLRTADGHMTSSTLLNSSGLDKRCDGHAYGFAMRWDGRALMEKEIKHPTYTNQISKNVWNGSTMPFNKWIGMKAITYSIDNGAHVKLEIWRDLTDGLNGGDWQKVNEYSDIGGWAIDATTAASCNVPADWIITAANPLVILRNDGVTSQLYKKVSIREIQP